MNNEIPVLNLQKSMNTIINIKDSNTNLISSTHKSSLSIGNGFSKYLHAGKRILITPNVASINPPPINNNEEATKSNLKVIKKINNHNRLVFKHPKVLNAVQKNNIITLCNPQIEEQESPIDDDLKIKKNLYLFPVFGDVQNDLVSSKPKAVYQQIKNQGI